MQLTKRNLRSVRNRRGANIAEFSVAFFALVFFGIIPFTNLLLFGTTYLGVTEMVNSAAHKAAMSESRSMARKCADTLQGQLKQPVFYLLHTVEVQSTDIYVVVVDAQGSRCEVAEKDKLPSKLDPRSSNGCQYYYRLNNCCSISPFFNLASVPAIGMIPIIGGPVKVSFSSEVHLEDPKSLNR